MGLAVAIAMGLAELAWYWVKDRRIDGFVLLDTLLIVILGVISIILENDVFFKIKPALIGILLCIILGISAFTPANYLLKMSKRYMKGIAVSPVYEQRMRESVRVMFWLFAAYTALVFYSVWFMSNEAWAFVSGGLFYILFGVFLGFEFLRSRLIQKRRKNEEWLPLLNEKGEVVGRAPRSVCHSDKQYLHPVVHLHVINSRGEIFLQKRPLHKIQPGKWDTAVGGHIAFGESVELSLRREAHEEIGLTDFVAKPLASYIWESDIEREYVFCFTTQFDGPFSINTNELADGRFWSHSEIISSIGKDVFTRNFEVEYRRFFDRKWKLSS